MIKLLQKLVILWEKSKFLTLMEMEADYIREVNRKILNRDTDALRTRLASLKASTDKKSDTQLEILEVEQQLNETEKFKEMIQKSKEKGLDLKKQIEKYRKDIWN